MYGVVAGEERRLSPLCRSAQRSLRVYCMGVGEVGTLGVGVEGVGIVPVVPVPDELLLGLPTPELDAPMNMFGL